MANLKRILIADDEESIRLLLRRILESNPVLEMTLADGGEEALRLAAERSYDLILLDLLMPGVGGIEVLTRLRSGSANKKTPIIIVSVLADAHTKIACQSLGVSGYLAKPIDRAAVIDAVNRVIGVPMSK
jgi:two-component system response regulator ResD